MLTPQALMRRGAIAQRESKIPLSAGVKTITYEDHPVLDIPDSLCWLCGIPTRGKGGMVRDHIADTFTDTCIKASYSDHLCGDCVWMFRTGAARGAWIRVYGHLATETSLHHPTRAGWREALLNPPEPPFFACIAVSGKKWLVFKARVALSRERFPVLFEESLLIITPGGFRALLEPVEELIALGFTREEIRTGLYSQHRILAAGRERWVALENVVNRERGGRLLELVIFVAQKREDACTTDSTPTTKVPLSAHSSSTSSGDREDGRSRSAPTSGGKSNATRQAPPSEQLNWLSSLSD